MTIGVSLSGPGGQRTAWAGTRRTRRGGGGGFGETSGGKGREGRCSCGQNIGIQLAKRILDAEKSGRITGWKVVNKETTYPYSARFECLFREACDTGGGKGE